MIKTQKVFFTNELEEASEIRTLLSENIIESEIVFHSDSPYWGTSNMQPMEDAFYKYVIVVDEKDSEKSMELIERRFSESENKD